MCGIIGVASTRTIDDRSWLAIGRDQMTHRGPDDAGELWSSDGRVGLAHRRLSIVDLSYSGHQPMRDKNNSTSIVFNGEIYNYLELRKELTRLGHTFISDSDTEVILKAYTQWGLDCVTRLNGMFAFALFDGVKGQLFLARDRAGEKPLFYHYDGNQLCFASELKGLLHSPTHSFRLNRESLDCYLGMGFVPGHRCIVEGVQKLPAAHTLLFDIQTGVLKTSRYWQLPSFENETSYSESDLVDELDSLLESSVQRQLAADVPVGVLLSGGVDSSLITAMAARVSTNVKTFTVRFPEHKAYDETPYARLIANHFGTEHIELDMGSTHIDLLGVMARQFDEPMVDSSMIPTYLVSQLVRKHCTVALGGDGGDELFGGYGRYSHLINVENRIGKIPFKLREAISNSAGKHLPIGFKGRGFLLSLGVDLRSNLPIYPSLFNSDARKKIVLDQYLGSSSVAENIWRGLVPIEHDLVQRYTRMDFQNYLAEDILVKVDRASMLNSLEMRAPMLDKHLIDFAFKKVPSHFKATADARKIILKKLTKRLLPETFDADRKQGFSIPLASWLQSNQWRSYFKEVLLDSSASVFNRKEINKLFKGQEKGHANSERLFSLVLFELWQKEYNISL